MTSANRRPRIGLIKDLNGSRYWSLASSGKWDVTFDSPSSLGHALSGGQLEAAIVPIRHAWALENRGVVKSLPRFGISACGGTGSTFLVGPANLADRRFHRISAANGSSSTLALARVILKARYNHDEISVANQPALDGKCPFVVIGNDALQLVTRAEQIATDWVCHDLSAIWYEWTQRPFVFAKWVYRQDAYEFDIEDLIASLHSAVSCPISVESMYESAPEGGNVPDSLRGAETETTRYLNRLRYALDSSDEEGSEMFHVLCREHLWPDARPGAATWWLRPNIRRNFFTSPNTDRNLPSLEAIVRRVTSGEDLNFAAGVRLMKELPTSELCALAHWLRESDVQGNAVTFVIDTNPNYSNICDAHCSFCAFYRPPGFHGSSAWEHSVDDLITAFKRAKQLGATTVLLQGGHHPSLPLAYYTELVRRTRSEVPGVTPHFFSAGEVRKMAEVDGSSIEKVLQDLWGAGQRSLPGGGAEVLSERVRDRISPLKGSVEDWIEVHRLAHQLGMKSTATMMYGHCESVDDIVEHLIRVRNLQHETGGFTAFIPWSFKPGKTPLSKKVGLRVSPGIDGYLRVISMARIMLRNVPNIQASFFSEGWMAGRSALHAGANDVGGVLLEENVHKAAGFVNPTPLNDVIEAIVDEGFVPRQRDTLYQIVHSEGGKKIDFK